MRILAPLLGFLLVIPAAARVNIALFPLENRSGDPLLEWIGYAVPEMAFRKTYEMPEVQAWDPVLLCRADPEIWRLQSDTLLFRHAARWGWDVALGGGYEATADTVWMRLVGVRRRDDRLLRKEWRIQCGTLDVSSAVSTFLLDFAGTLGVGLTASDTALVLRDLPGQPHVFATYARGYGYEMRGQPAQAVSSYLHALGLDKDLGMAHLRIGRLFAENREFAAARGHFDKALALLKGSAYAVAVVGGFRVATDSRTRAMTYADDHRALLEKTAEGMQVIGRAYLTQGEYQRAIAILTRAVAAGPVDLETDFALGEAYLATGQFDLAIGVFSRLIEIRPRFVRYYSFLGMAYRSAGKLMESSNTLEAGRRLAPDDVPNLLNLSTTYFQLGWYREAEQLLLRAIEVQPGLVEIYTNLAAIYWHMGDKKAAEKTFDRVEKSGARMQSAINNRGNMLFLSGNVRGAAKEYRRADKEGSKSEAILYNLGEAYLARGKSKEAAACFDEVLLLAPSRLDVAVKQAEIAERLGKREDAELHYRKILDLAPNERAVVAKLVALIEGQGRLEEAVKLVETYLQTYPSDLSFRLRLPELYRKMEWYEVAVMEYEKLAGDRDFRDDYRVHLGLGRSIFDVIVNKNGKAYDKAIFHLQEAARLSSGDPEPDKLIALIYMDYKKYPDMANEHWEKALAKAVTDTQRKEIKRLMAGVRK